jgi:hypothetical protein
MKFKVRALKPKESPWFDVEAQTSDEALREFHFREVNCKSGYGGIRKRVEDEDGMHLVFFALIEVEGEEAKVSRIFEYGIWRCGGVKSKEITLKEIADALGWTHDPEDLLGEWDNEETMEEAEARKFA